MSFGERRLAGAAAGPGDSRAHRRAPVADWQRTCWRF